MPSSARRVFMTAMQKRGAAPSITLPYTFDPSALPDGALPAPWEGGNDTWSISSGVIVNAPTFGAELLTDGGLEAGYTDGKCDSLTGLTGTPTLAESADAHSGSKAQSFIGSAANQILGFPAVVPTAQKWYQFSLYRKRAAGINGRTSPQIGQSSGVPISTATNGVGATDASYTENRLVRRANSTNNMFFQIAITPVSAATDTVLHDTCSAKQFISDSLIKIIDSESAPQIVKVRNNWNGKFGLSGCIARCNADKSSFLLAYYWLQGSTPFAFCVLEQCLNGVFSPPLIATWSNSGGAGAGSMPTTSQDLEIRVTGNTAQLFHNDVQVGTDKTIDASLASNTYVGIFDTGGNSVNLFFVQAN